MTQKPNKAGIPERLQHFDKVFTAKLEELYKRTGLQRRQDFAKFLGVTYVTYCNWRVGRYEKLNDFPKYSIDAYCRLSDKELRALVVERSVE